MSLADAHIVGGPTPALPPGPLFAANALQEWAGSSFWMSPGDPILESIHHGGSVPPGPMCNLVGLVKAWDDHPEWLDFLDPGAPSHKQKLLERGIYEHHWGDLLPSTGRVLDLGGGCGRFAAWLLDRGLDVEVVDPDLRSLWRCLQHASGRPGRLDLHWSTGEALPEVAPLDAVIAPEVLCYCSDPDAIIKSVAQRLKPGGRLFCSVEARWGWAAALDVPAGTLASLLEDGVVHLPGDVWVHTYEETELANLLAPYFQVESMIPTHYVPSGPFELAAGEVDLEEILALEEQLRSHPKTAHLNRAWLAVARKI